MGNCNPMCGKAHYAYCLMEMVKNHHNRGECHSMLLCGSNLSADVQGGFFISKNVRYPLKDDSACEACGCAAMLPAGGTEKLNRELKKPREEACGKEERGERPHTETVL